MPCRSLVFFSPVAGSTDTMMVSKSRRPWRVGIASRPPFTRYLFQNLGGLAASRLTAAGGVSDDS